MRTHPHSFATEVGLAFTSALLGTTLHLGAAHAACPAVPGDINNNGVANIVDVQCAIATIAWELTGSVGSPPGCLPPGLLEAAADLDCDGTASTADASIAIKSALGSPLGSIDFNANGCADTCELTGNAAGCCTDDGTGCGEVACAQCVCFLDPSCCNTVWDITCVEFADFNCGGLVYRDTAPLLGSNELPPVTTKASGTATVWLTNDDVLRWRIEHNVVGATMAHIHQGAAGTNGPVKLGFDSPNSPILGSAPVDDATKAALLAGELYINIHSATFPGGELRGQLVMQTIDLPCSCAANFDANPCDPEPCQNGATCTFEGPDITCICPPGYGGELCEINIDDCAGSPCQNGGQCVDDLNTFYCLCPGTFFGTLCECEVQNTVAKFDDIGTFAVPSYTVPGGAVTVSGSANVNVLNLNGLGIVGGVSTNLVDGSEWIEFVFSQPVTNLSYFVSSATNFNGNSLNGESTYSAYNAAGSLIGTVASSGSGMNAVSATLGPTPVARLRVQALADGFRIGQLFFSQEVCP